MNNQLVYKSIDEIKKVLLEQIMMCYSFTGYNSENVDYATQVLQMVGVLNQPRFAKFRVDTNKIKIAFQNGVQLSYGEFKGLSPLTYTMWLESYLKSEIKPNGQLEHERVKERQKELPMSDEKLREIQQNNYDYIVFRLKNAIDRVNQGGEPLNHNDIYDPKNVVFERLRNEGLIKLTNEQYTYYMNKATDIDNAELEAKKQTEILSQNRIAVQDILRKIASDRSEYIKAIARRLALMDYLLSKEFSS